MKLIFMLRLGNLDHISFGGNEIFWSPCSYNVVDVFSFAIILSKKFKESSNIRFAVSWISISCRRVTACLKIDCARIDSWSTECLTTNPSTKYKCNLGIFVCVGRLPFRNNGSVIVRFSSHFLAPTVNFLRSPAECFLNIDNEIIKVNWSVIYLQCLF